MRAVAIALLLGSLATDARAECSDLVGAHDPCPWYRGPSSKRRIVNLAITVAGGVAYATSQILESHLSAVQCRWCSADSLDTSVRNAVLWGDVGTARTLSNITGYAVTPALALGLVLAGSIDPDSNTNVVRVFDDTLPILETASLGEALVQTVKFAVGRQRPFVHFGPPAPHDPEDNVSFFSAHSTLVFGIVTSAGVVAHHRGYKTEPYIWTIGLALAATTAYLRLAGDEHYFTDVLTGTAVGVATGLTVPLLSRTDTHVVVAGDGAAIAGTW